MVERAEPGPGRAEAATAVPGATGRWRVVLLPPAIAVALFAFARAVLSPQALLNDPDTYLHIATGDWMLAHHALPVVDRFSFSLPGAVWIPGEWLGEVILAAAYRFGGWNAIVLLTAGCFAAAAGLLAGFLGRRMGALPGMIATVAGAALVLPHLLARPHILALPLLVAWCGLVLRARDEGTDPPWPALPLIVLWANLHASVLFGIGLAGFAAVETALMSPDAGSRLRQSGRWCGFATMAAALALLTPNGVDGIVQPFGLMAMPALQASFAEWGPAQVTNFPALELWLLGVVALGFVVRSGLPPLRLALLLLLIHMALQHVRHADLLGLVGPLGIAAAVAPCLTARLGRGPARIGWRTRRPGLAVAALAGIAVAAPLLLRPLSRGDDAVTPASALAAAQRIGIRGPVFNSESFGGYLVFAGVPAFIDGRIEMYGNDFLAADVAAESGDAAALTRLLARYRIDWTLLKPKAGAVAVLDHLPGWHRAYADGIAVIHVRTVVPGE